MGSNRRARRPTLHDVAKLAGVDASTVSRVLLDVRANEFRPETRNRILAVVEQLGYRPNVAARGLQAQKQNAIALLVPDFDNFGFTEILRGVQERLVERDTSLLLAEVRDADHVRHFHDGHALIGRIDGLLVAVGHWDEAELAHWQSLNVPIVFVQRDVPNAPSAVLMDEERNAAAMIEHLVGLGHRDIAHVAGALDTDTGLRRRRGVLHAADRAGLTIPARWIVDGGFTADGGLRATLAILHSRGPRPSALAVANLTSALGALDALREAGLRVPDDVSLIAIDDHFVAAHTNPPLTTVRTAQRVLGRAAADGIIDAVESGRLKRTVIPNEPIIIARESTARPRAERLPRRRAPHQSRAGDLG